MLPTILMPPPSSAFDPPAPGLYNLVDVETKEIRLLTVAAGAGDEVLRCSLKHVKLSDSSTRESYETVSYAWGNPNDRTPIYIDGRLVDIPSSAHRALRRMQNPSRERTLWIDAVCINQSDKVERSNQVALMSEVYSSSAGNLVWLGEANETTEKALASIQCMCIASRRSTAPTLILRSNP